MNRWDKKFLGKMIFVVLFVSVLISIFISMIIKSKETFFFRLSTNLFISGVILMTIGIFFDIRARILSFRNRHIIKEFEEKEKNSKNEYKKLDLKTKLGKILYKRDIFKLFYKIFLISGVLTFLSTIIISLLKLA